MLTNQDQIWNNLPRYMNIYIYMGMMVSRGNYPQMTSTMFGFLWKFMGNLMETQGFSYGNPYVLEKIMVVKGFLFGFYDIWANCNISLT